MWVDASTRRSLIDLGFAVRDAAKGHRPACSAVMIPALRFAAHDPPNERTSPRRAALPHLGATISNQTEQVNSPVFATYGFGRTIRGAQDTAEGTLA